MGAIRSRSILQHNYNTRQFYLITTEIILSFKYDRREISKIKKTLQLTTYYRDH